MSEDNNMNFKIGDKVIIDNDKLENHNKKGIIIDVFDNGKLAVILDVVGGISFYNDNDLKLTETIEKESVVEVANPQGHCFKDNRNLEKEYAEQVKEEEKFEFDPDKPFFDVGDNVIYVGDNFKDFKGMTGRIVELDKEHWKYKVDFAGKISDYIEEDWLEPADGVKKKFTDDVMEQIKREAEERKAEKKKKELTEKANCNCEYKIGDIVEVINKENKFFKNVGEIIGVDSLYICVKFYFPGKIEERYFKKCELKLMATSNKQIAEKANCNDGVNEKYEEAIKELDKAMQNTCVQVTGPISERALKALREQSGHINVLEDRKPDMVNHPLHYCQEDGLECIEVMQLLFGKKAVIDYCRCNIFKYRFRAEHKNGDEDIKKAQWYENKLNELLGACFTVKGKA